MNRRSRLRHRLVLMAALLGVTLQPGGPALAQLLGGLAPPTQTPPSPATGQPPPILPPLVNTVTGPLVSTVTAVTGAVPSQQLLGVAGPVQGVVQAGTGAVGGVVAVGSALTTDLTRGVATTVDGLTNTVGSVTTTVGSVTTNVGGLVGGLTNDTRALLGATVGSPGTAPQPPMGVFLRPHDALMAAPTSNLGAPLAVSTNIPASASAPIGDLAAAADGGARRFRVQALLRDNPGTIEADTQGQPVVRGEALALSPTPEALAKAQQAGFIVGEEGRLDGLDLGLVVLKAPPGMSAVQAVAKLRALDRDGQYDFNHLYLPSGDTKPSSKRQDPVRAAPVSARRVGLVDGGVAENHPALTAVRIVQQGFAGPPRASAHGTAVASLMAGRQGQFRGAVQPGALYVADVYGGSPTGGSAAGLARALAWMAQNRAPVVNISLVGPDNLTLAAAVRAMVARGHLLVAAVGNDGPAAPPLYPAAYPGVVAVTAVDGRRRLLPEAGRGGHVDFTAPGADMAAAGLDGGFVAVRGTSFAAPLAAGRLAALHAEPDPAAAARAVAALARQAVDLGPVGRDRIYGRGLVAFELRTDPVLVAARGVVRGP